MKDFEITPEIMDSAETDLLDEKIQEATQRIAQERERMLALALYKGYDGVDVHTKNQVMTGINQYKLGYEYEAWEGEPPTLDRFGQGVTRYDFTALTDDEKRMLLAQIGVQLEDWKDD